MFTVPLWAVALAMFAAAAFFETTERLQNVALRGMYLPWQVVAVTGVAVGLIVLIASVLSLRRVLVLEPGMVFK